MHRSNQLAAMLGMLAVIVAVDYADEIEAWIAYRRLHRRSITRRIEALERELERANAAP